MINLILKLTIWFLLTSDLSLVNIILGIIIALIIPPNSTNPEKLKDWLKILVEIIIAIPQAYFEAFEMIFRPHNQEKITMERVKPGRSLSLIFLDIFLITFTPKTIVLKYHKKGWYEVHRVTSRRET